MGTPKSNGCYPPPLDFERASLAWVTKDNSHGRWRLIASTACWSPRAGEYNRFVLSPRIMAGDVYGTGKLPLDPPYGFQIVASPQRHVIIRDFEHDLPNRDTSDSNFEVFSDLVINAPPLECGRLDADLLTPKTIAQVWPLTARLHATIDGVDHLVDFPVVHINTKQIGKPAAFQIETGPVLLPAALIDNPALTTGGFALAFVFFNRLDRLDLAIWGPVGAAGTVQRGYVHFARWDGVVIELYGDRSSQGANGRIA
jgi:hypothetical protein